MMFSTSALFISLLALGAAGKATPRHVVLIMTDDQGFSDVGYRDSTFSTPNIDNLKEKGISLERLYAQPSCSPTRASLLTGRYANNIGTQDSAFVIAEDRVLSTEYPLLPETLKSAGYKSVGIGKWHLGHNSVENMPLERGFDSFFGILNGANDYFTYEIGGACGAANPFNPTQFPPTWGTGCAFHNGVDLIDNDAPADLSTIKSGRYITELFGERAVAEIESHDADEPLFMYFAPTAPHTPLQVPPQYLTRCGGVTDPVGSYIPNGRRLICGMMAAVDDQVGNIINALDGKGMLDNTLFIYLSDNGGVTNYGSVNGNFRGQKTSFFEGGVRVPGFLSGKPVQVWQDSGSSFDEMVHVVDLYASVLTYAGVSLPEGTDGTSVVRTNGNGKKVKVRLDHEFSRDVLPLGARGDLLFHSSNAVVFKHADRLWKYTYYPNVVSVIVRYDLQPLNCVHLFDLTNDPSETTNLATSTDAAAVSALAAGMQLVDATEGVPSPVDAAGGVFLRNANGLSPRGCWIPSDHPAYLTADCGLQAGVDWIPFLSPTGQPLPPSFPIPFPGAPAIPPQC